MGLLHRASAKGPLHTAPKMGSLYVLPIKGSLQMGLLFTEECTNKGLSKNVLPIRAISKGPPKGVSNGALHKGPLMPEP